MILLPNNIVRHEYMAKVLRIIDGDTIDVLIDLGFNIHLKDRIRLYGVNTPETRTRDKKEKEAGMRATIHVTQALLPFKDLQVPIKIETVKKGKYGRYLAMVWIPTSGLDDTYWNLNQDLIDQGLAKEYYGGKR